MGEHDAMAVPKGKIKARMTRPWRVDAMLRHFNVVFLYKSTTNIRLNANIGQKRQIAIRNPGLFCVSIWLRINTLHDENMLVTYISYTINQTNVDSFWFTCTT